jgi:Htaa
VRFAGHHGFMFVRVADPWLELTGSTGTVTVPGDPADDGSPERMPLVTFELVPPSEPAPPGATRHGTRVRLTAEGSELFNTVYPEGEPFEDLFFTLSSTSPATAPLSRDRGETQ